MKKLLRVSTVAISLDVLLKGQLSFLNAHYEVVAVSGADPHLDAVAAREGVRTVSVPMQRAISPFKDLVSLVRLYMLFKKERPDAVHSITPKAGLLSMTAAYFAGVPVRMHTFTGLIFPSATGFKHHLLVAMDRLLCFFATHVYPEGAGVRTDLQHYRITSKPLSVLANGNVNGIDVAYFSPTSVSDATRHELRARLGLSTADFVFVFVGRLVQDKGVAELVAAFLQLVATQPHCRLLLVGPFESAFDPLPAATLAAIEATPEIVCVGWQDDVRPYFSISTALVFPSYREGFPNVVLQAGAMGLPSIVSAINGCNEIILPGVNGILVPSKDTVSLYNGLLRFVADPVFCAHLQASARELILSRYEQEVVWAALLDEYQRIMGQ